MTDAKTQFEACDLAKAERRYAKYALRRRSAAGAAEMPFEVWLVFREWGKRGGALSTSDRSAAGKLGAAAARKRIEERLKAKG